METENELSLIDLIDADALDSIETAFCEMTGMSAGISTPQGARITAGNYMTDFCRLVKSSKTGRSRCEYCDRRGAAMATEHNSAVFYRCHTGMIDFAAPITINEKIMGCFVGGQILTSEPDEKQAERYSQELNIAPDKYLAALRRVPIMSNTQINDAAEFLYTLSNVISRIGYSRFKILQSNMELEQATQSKSDFLANMSHEIRTPMNAIIGMSEMAMREPLPPAANEYISQIKSSGQTLLTIINDILDFSKIESGTINIHKTEYHPVTLVSEVVNAIMTRIDNKDIEFVVDIAPDLPTILYGDQIRIIQIILNLTNNAVKFTQYGQIMLKIEFENIDAENIMLHVSVQDTGSGIRKEDIGKLFNAFERVNERKTKNIEGTGLGLAITKQFLTLMNGDIQVESEYGAGSCFSFTLPQKVIKADPCIIVKNQKNLHTAGLLHNHYVSSQLVTSIERLGIDYIPLQTPKELTQGKKYNINFLFIEHALFTNEVEFYIRSHPEITAVLLVNFKTTIKLDIPNLIVVKKPLYAADIASILNKEPYIDPNQSEDKENTFDYIAPNAQILIVDDNSVNLTVAVGLLEPLKMQIDTALSAKDAIEKVARHCYDLILMDHMMPEIDGIEATHIIRRFYTNYNSVPIIALSANAVDGAEKMFLKEGMNDFVPKPIELPVLLSVLRRWLPKEKILQSEPNNGAAVPFQPLSIQIDALDTDSALKLLGSEKLFWEVLKDYYKVIRKKADLIHRLEQDEDWKSYTTEVHALKSASKQIGAVELAEIAARMEQAGNERDAALIHEHTPGMLEQYLAYDRILREYIPEESDKNTDTPKPLATSDDLRQFFSILRFAFENLDMDQMEEAVETMKLYSYKKDQEELFTQLCGAVDEIDTDASEDIIKMWETKL